MKVKQWSLKAVVDSLKYNNVEYSNHHNVFKDWITGSFNRKIDIIDIGGGNGRVVLNIKEHINKYTCLDLNEYNIKIGNDFFESDSITFKLFDIDTDELNLKCDVVYIDSVLEMLEDPFKCLIKMVEVSDYIFVNRTVLSDKETTESQYKWGGMDEPSKLWKFSFKDMENFCLKNNFA